MTRKHGNGRHKTVWRPSPEQLDLYEAAIRGDKTQAQVAKDFGKAPSTVSELIDRIDSWLIPQYMDEIRKIKANHTNRLMMIHRESLAEYHRSKKPKASKRWKNGEQGTELAELAEEGRVGSHAHLAVAIKALEDVRKIWGIDEPEQIQGETLLRVAGMSRKEAIQKRRAELDAAEKVENEAATSDPES